MACAQRTETIRRADAKRWQHEPHQARVERAAPRGIACTRRRAREGFIAAPAEQKGGPDEACSLTPKSSVS